MKTIFKWLIPGFMRRLDTFLLENYPVVWRTRGHYVLYFSLLLVPVLFMLGFAYSVSAADLTVDPYNHIIFFYDTLNKAVLFLFSIGLLYWAYTQYQIGFPSATLKDSLLTLLIYGAGLFVMLAVAAPMFRLGTIVRTAYFFVDDKDLNDWAAHDFYSYGFIFYDSDTFNIQPQALSNYFREREKSLSEIRRLEDEILSYRYDIDFFDSLGVLLERDFQRRSINLKVSFIASLQYFEDRAYIPRPGYTFSLLTKHFAYWYYLPNLEKIKYKGNPPKNAQPYNFISNRSYRYYQAFRVTEEEDMYRLYHADWGLLTRYNAYYFTQKNPVLRRSVVEKYGIPVGLDTITLDTFRLLKPQLPYALENTYRSVQHARQFIQKGIHFWHYKTLLYFLPFLTLLLYAAPFLSFRQALGALTIAAIGAALNISLDFSDLFTKYWYYWHSLVYLALPIAGFFLLIQAAMMRKHMAFVSFGFHLIVLGLAMILLLALYGDKGIFNTTALTINKPVNLAFFGVQVIGLAGVLLRTYLQALPRQ